MEKETKLLKLIHTDLSDLNQTITRGGKKYYVTFINYQSRYTKVCLLKYKYDVFYAFVSYKAEIENQLDKKTKGVKSE